MWLTISLCAAWLPAGGIGARRIDWPTIGTVGRRDGLLRPGSCCGSELSVLLLLQLVGRKLPLERVHIVRGIVLNIGLRWIVFGCLRRRGHLLPGADERRQEKQADRAHIEHRLEVLLQHAFRLRRPVGQLRVFESRCAVCHSVTPFS